MDVKVVERLRKPLKDHINNDNNDPNNDDDYLSNE